MIRDPFGPRTPAMESGAGAKSARKPRPHHSIAAQMGWAPVQPAKHMTDMVLSEAQSAFVPHGRVQTVDPFSQLPSDP